MLLSRLGFGPRGLNVFCDDGSLVPRVGASRLFLPLIHSEMKPSNSQTFQNKFTQLSSCGSARVEARAKSVMLIVSRASSEPSVPTLARADSATSREAPPESKLLDEGTNRKQRQQFADVLDEIDNANTRSRRQGVVKKLHVFKKDEVQTVERF